MSDNRLWLIWAGVSGPVLLGALYAFAPVLTPFVLGFVLAYFLTPLADRLEGWGLSRLLAVSVMVLVFVIVVVAVGIYGVPVLVRSVMQFASAVPSKLQNLQQWLALQDLAIPSDLLASLSNAAAEFVRSGAKGLFAHGAGFFNVLSLVVITPVVTFYILKDWNSILAGMDTHLIAGQLSKPAAKRWRRFFQEVDQMLASVVRGQLSVCALMALFYASALLLLGLDGAIAVGLFAGLLSFIPFVGAILGILLALFLVISQFGLHAELLLAVGAVFAVGQFLEGNILTPFMVGDRARLHPVAVIFALLAFGHLFGFVGLLLALPLAAILGAALRFWWIKAP